MHVSLSPPRRRRPPSAFPRIILAVNVDIAEILPVDEAYASGQYTRSGEFEIENFYDGVDPIDSDCYVGKCIGLLTRVSKCLGHPPHHELLLFCYGWGLQFLNRSTIAMEDLFNQPLYIL